MDDRTVEGEKENTQLNRTRNHDNTSERRINWGNKGTDQSGISDKGQPKKNKEWVKGVKEVPKE
jgi:hypothetical protein